MYWIIGILVMVAVVCIAHNIALKKQMREISEYLEQYLTYPDMEYHETLKEGEWANLHNNIYSICRQWKYEQDRHKRDLKEMNHFVENLAHQLRNALTSLQLRMDELDLAVENEAEKELCEKCQTSMSRIESEVNQLLNSSLLAAGKVKMKYQKISFTEMLEEIAANLRALCESKQVTVKCEVEEDEFYADPFWLSQALENIIKNAIEHTKNHSEVNVKVAKTEDSIQISVRDHGEGIPEDKMERLFERYYRGDESKKGYGIGLSMARDIVITHHGKLIMSKMNDKGSKMVINLPVH